jgi:tRNA threonylcarbamoyladenosine modification (KEOPS) complex  Pcc1 subunit
MGLTELTSRIRQSGAQAALIISIWRGNPGELTVLSPQGDEIIKLRLESALLRREIDSSNKGRVGTIEGVGVKSGSSERVWNLARDFATLLSLNIKDYSDPAESRTERNRALLWFEDAPSEKILWTQYNTKDLSEIGPRIRVSSVRRLVKMSQSDVKGNSILEISLESEHIAKILYSALLPETESIPSERAITSISVKGSSLVVEIIANDLTAMRAALNSYIAWISACMKTIEAIDES